MDIIERQIPLRSVPCPRRLSRNVHRLCREKSLEIEAFEVHDDIYIIRLRRPKPVRTISSDSAESLQYSAQAKSSNTNQIKHQHYSMYDNGGM
ncbi:hypothetical protein SAMD00023353_12500140 [Rosellinia necatrix]|uniref:Uncharacterized protein n=1 Tax=Rosellinia necatrix TaxID=77044 RepID=A0A1S8ABC7_ROSNE|nr:hypothetical protein SAMD00023353_12500140 [Rosellinia necatrix]